METSFTRQCTSQQTELGLGDKRDDPERGTASAFDFHGQSDHECASWWNLVEIGDILEGRYVFFEENAVSSKSLRLSVIDTRGVEADGGDVSVLGQPAGCSRSQPRKV